MIATIPAPQTFDEVLRECQHYYEKSYDNSVVPGTASSFSLISAEQFGFKIDGSNICMVTRSFGFEFNTAKRVAPTLTFYSPTGTINTIEGLLFNAGNPSPVAIGDIAIANWTVGQIGTKSATYFTSNVTQFLTTAAVSNQQEAIINFQFTADARLGVV
jgi:hypothetical protein